MIHLATSYTPGYAWAEPFLASLRQHCNVPFTVFEVDGRALLPQRPDQNPTDMGGAAATALPITVPPPPGIPNGMLQHGAFLEHLPLTWVSNDGENDSEIILFLDADMIMQRPLNEAEFCWLEGLHDEDICVGINGFPGETLAHEAPLLRPKVEEWVLDELFPGWREIPAWNTGFVAARRSAYLRLYDMARALMPAGVACFDHYAVVQFVMSYCFGKWLSHVELPRTIHLHGCWKLPEEASANEQGEMFLNGEKVAFRHAVNLNPPKGAVCEPNPGRADAPRRPDQNIQHSTFNIQ